MNEVYFSRNSVSKMYFSMEITKTERGPTLSSNSSKSGNKCNRPRKVTPVDLVPETSTGEPLDCILALKERFIFILNRFLQRKSNSETVEKVRPPPDTELVLLVSLPSCPKPATHT